MSLELSSEDSLGDRSAPALNAPEDVVERVAPLAEDSQRDIREQRDERVGELGASLMAAGGRVADLQRLLAGASGHVEELAALLDAARGAQLAAHELSMRDQAARSKDLEALHTRSQARAEELTQALASAQARGAQLEADLGEAHVTIASSAQDVHSAKLRAEAARLDADAARLDAQAAWLEVEASRQDVETAHQETRRFRLATETAIEQLQAAREQQAAAGALDQEPTSAASEEPEPPTAAPEDREPPTAAPDEQEPTTGEIAPAGGPALRAPETDRPEPPATDVPDVVLQAPESAEGTVDPPAVSAEPLPTPRPASRLTWTRSAQLALTATVVDCQSSRLVFGEAVNVIGSRGGWDAVIAWTPDARARYFSCTEMWCSEPQEMAQFRRSMSQVREDANVSPVGRVAMTGRLEWFGDPETSGDSALTLPASEGIASIVLLPVRRGTETIAVLELCSRDAGEPDEDLRTALETTAAELVYAQQQLSPTESTRWKSWRRR